MTNILRYTVLFLLAISMQACISEIEFDPINNIEDTLAIQGQFARGNPHVFSARIGRVRDFSGMSTPIVVREVVLSNELGQEVVVPNTDRDFYEMSIPLNSPDFMVEDFMTFSLRVRTADGRIYQSTSEALLPVPRMEEVNATIVEREAIGAADRIVLQPMISYSVNTGLTIPNTSDLIGLRWTFSETYQLTDTPVDGSDPKSCFIFQGLGAADEVVVDPQELGLDRLDDFILFERSIGNTYAEGNYFTILQYSLSPGAQEYFNAVSNIIVRDGNIFESPAGRIVSNFSNIDDPEDEVFGYFYATNIDTTRVFLGPAELGPITPRCPAVSERPVDCPDRACCDCLDEDNSSLERLILSVWAQSFAQGDSFIVQLNKPFYSQGEKMYYKLFLPMAYADQSAAVNIRLYKSGALLSQFYNRSSGSSSISGEISIPVDYENGDYQLAFFIADATQKLTENIGLIDFRIYNDLSEGELVPSEGYQSLSENDHTSLSLVAKFDSIVGPRSNNKISLAVLDEDREPVPAEFSVSILDKALIFGQQDVFISTTRQSHYSIKTPSPNLFFQGLVTDDNNTPLELKIMGVWSIERQDFSFAKSNAEGQFFFELDDFEGEQNIQFVRYDHALDNFNYKLMAPSLKAPSKSANIGVVSVAAYLSESRTRRKLAQYFGYSNEQNQVINSIKPAAPPRPNVYYELSEYKRFETIGNFIKELSTALNFRVDDEGKYTAKMTNPKSRRIGDFYLGETPIFIIDGMISRNPNFVGSIPFDDVKDIKLYYDLKDLRKMYNVMGRDGAVIVQTTLPNFRLDEDEAADIFTLNGLQVGSGILNHIPDVVSPDSTSPMFSPTIYWNPSVMTGENGRAAFDFYHTDDVGDFVMMILARTEDGQLVSRIIEYTAQAAE